MADSLSKQLLVAIVSKLQAAATDGLSVNRSRSVAVAVGDMPMISVYRVEEEQTPVGQPRRSILAQRNLIVEIMIQAAGDDDACDPYHQMVVAAMATDPTLGGLALSTTELKTAWIAEEGSDNFTVSTFLRYRVEYTTLPADLTAKPTATPQGR